MGLLLVPGWSREREDVGGVLFQGAAEHAWFGGHGRDAAGGGADGLLHDDLAGLAVGSAVGGDDPLVDAPGRLGLGVSLIGEQCASTRACCRR